MIREVDLARLRFYASLAAIAAGLAILLYIGSTHLSDAVDDPKPPAGLTRGTIEDCPAGWRFVDNLEQRYTVCLPSSLFYYDGVAALSLADATNDDWDRIFRDFALVNEAGLSLTRVEDSDPDMAAISLRVAVVPPDTTFDGCALRSQVPAENGAVACDDILAFFEGEALPATEGPLHRFRALVPTLPGKSANEVFSLYLSLTGLSDDWALQEPLFREVLASLKPY